MLSEFYDLVVETMLSLWCMVSQGTLPQLFVHPDQLNMYCDLIFSETMSHALCFFLCVKDLKHATCFFLPLSLLNKVSASF